MCNLSLAPLVITCVHPFSGCTRTHPGNWLLFLASKWYWKGCLSVILTVERRWGFWIQTHSGDWHLDAVQVICKKSCHDPLPVIINFIKYICAQTFYYPWWTFDIIILLEFQIFNNLSRGGCSFDQPTLHVGKMTIKFYFLSFSVCSVFENIMTWKL